MIREFNYTQRKRIESQHVQIELLSDGGAGTFSFEVALNLEDLHLPSDSLVVIEAERDLVSNRFEWGMVGNPQPPESKDLSEVPFPPKFRAMIIAPDNSRRILALRNDVKAKWDRISQTAASELIHVQEEDLGQEVWRLDFGSSDDIPVLKVNKNMEGMSQAVRSDRAFRSLVLPEVLRSILSHMLFVEGAHPDDDDRLTWFGWFGFVSQFYSLEDCPRSIETGDTEQRKATSDWINAAVNSFTEQRFNASKQYAEARG